MAGCLLLVAVLVAACTALFDNDDLSAFLYPDELNSILSKQDEDLWCWYVRSAILHRKHTMIHTCSRHYGDVVWDCFAVI